ncbi:MULTISPECIES: metalloregulator ArsR/SmtB family transcription factor [unclassified Rothia (in: high G+C Gram-positive bacteria)]|uniref:ArsR/SmtB family transcription factor n=1 Tax=unclassified Rothia (in: high G+C Gram-positive bacteria) TaxID=2689056 RepID=UPI001EF41207|nr:MULTISPECIES: metalloregulator ArsR/SmtB family transcription factor [unclassified Rothia (in: high G+C Gram-positive bacteria)]
MATESAVPVEHIARKAQFYKALGDERRLTLVYLIDSSPEKSVCVCDLTEPLGLKQSTVSHHLKILVDAGILAREQRGTWAHYSVAASAQECISTLWKEHP